MMLAIQTQFLDIMIKKINRTGTTETKKIETHKVSIGMIKIKKTAIIVKVHKIVEKIRKATQKMLFITRKTSLWTSNMRSSCTVSLISKLPKPKVNLSFIHQIPCTWFQIQLWIHLRLLYPLIPIKWMFIQWI